MNKKQKIIREHLTCTCDKAYKTRNLTDPYCFFCEYESEIELIMQEYTDQQLLSFYNFLLNNSYTNKRFKANTLIEKFKITTKLKNE